VWRSSDYLLAACLQETTEEVGLAEASALEHDGDAVEWAALRDGERNAGRKLALEAKCVDA
jgi:hypothetical protein